ncbi:MAG: hypothetical protein R3279_11600, partial [Putridiphycobacter sp.]|nr:hypothetical protein [Putridiphycobacter sp.]
MKNIFILITLVLTASSIAQNRMTPELLWDLKRVSGIQVSPDYKKVLFSQKTYDLSTNESKSSFYLVNVSTKLTSVIPNIDGKAWNAQWRPDGKKIGFLMRDDIGINVYEINVDGTGLKRISNLDFKVSEFKYAPDGKRLMFTKDVKLEKHTSREFETDLVRSNARVYDDLMYRHWSDYNEGYFTHIFFSVIDNGSLAGTGIDIMKDEKYDAPMKPFGGLEQATFSPDGAEIAYTSKKLSGKKYAISTNSDIYVYNTNTLQTVNVSKGMMGYD